MSLIFVLFLKGKQNKKEKLLNVTLDKKKQVWEKPSLGPKGQVTYWECTMEA